MLARIKVWLLSLYTRAYARYSCIKRTNVGFDQALSIGIVYSGGSVEKQEAISWFVTQLKQLGKQVTLLCYLPGNCQVTCPKVLTVRQRDLKLWGTISCPLVRSFVRTKFDYLYQIDLERKTELDYLLVQSHAKCRVGYYDFARTFLFEMMVGLKKKSGGDDAVALAAQMLHYTRSI